MSNSPQNSTTKHGFNSPLIVTDQHMKVIEGEEPRKETTKNYTFFPHQCRTERPLDNTGSLKPQNIRKMSTTQNICFLLTAGILILPSTGGEINYQSDFSKETKIWFH